MIALAIMTASWVNSPIVFGRMLKEEIVNVVQVGKLVHAAACWMCTDARIKAL